MTSKKTQDSLLRRKGKNSLPRVLTTIFLRALVFFSSIKIKICIHGNIPWILAEGFQTEKWTGPQRLRSWNRRLGELKHTKTPKTMNVEKTRCAGFHQWWWEALDQRARSWQWSRPNLTNTCTIGKLTDDIFRKTTHQRHTFWWVMTHVMCYHYQSSIIKFEVLCMPHAR